MNAAGSLPMNTAHKGAAARNGGRHRGPDILQILADQIGRKQSSRDVTARPEADDLGADDGRFAAHEEPSAADNDNGRLETLESLARTYEEDAPVAGPDEDETQGDPFFI